MIKRYDVVSMDDYELEESPDGKLVLWDDVAPNLPGAPSTSTGGYTRTCSHFSPGQACVWHPGDNCDHAPCYPIERNQETNHAHR